MISLMNCLNELQNNGDDSSLTQPVKLAIRRCASLLTGHECNTIRNRMKRIYDKEGKIAAIKAYRLETSCDLIDAKKQIENWFNYTSPYYK